MTFPASLSNHAGSGVLDIVWDDGEHQQLRNSTLRQLCMCADCKSLRLRSGVELTVDAQTTISEIRMVGQYAAQFVFSDGHERGIFPWVYLKRLPPGGG
jgi:DUF971 family protein